MDQPGVALILLAGGAHSKSMDFFLKYPDYIHAYVSFPSSLTKRCFSLVCKKKKMSAAQHQPSVYAPESKKKSDEFKFNLPNC